MLKDWVLTSTTGSVHINEFYKPRPELQLSRYTRETFARAYYSQTRFIAYSFNRWDIIHCLSSIPRHHLSLIRHFEFHVVIPFRDIFMHLIAVTQLADLKACIYRRLGVELWAGVLRLKCVYETEEMETVNEGPLKRGSTDPTLPALPRLEP